MQDFGTEIVAVVNPGQKGKQVQGVPIFNTVDEAKHEGANTSLVLVPAPFAKDAIIESLDAGITTIITVTEHIPCHDAMDFFHYGIYKGARLIGPNSPGIASPGKNKIGILPNNIFREGSVGVVSRSGTLTYEIVNELSENGIGQTTCIDLGGDSIIGTTFIDALNAFERDSETRAIVLIGEIGGIAEEQAAKYITKKVEKPVYVYIAGRATAVPRAKRMGHADAIIWRGRGTAQSKIQAFEEAQAKIAWFPNEIPELIKQDGIL
jgi:succinyl-CoA synthetase alpha subunit